ncbi:MAG: uracil-DNA glycosylase family protein [Ignavibacteriaceae bacterium]
MSARKKAIIESLNAQKEIFGDLLYQKVERKSISKQQIETHTQTIAPNKLTEPELFQADFEKATSLEELNSLICNCKICALGQTRKKFVFGKGNPNAEVMCIGEGPGADEDEQGEPFVGRAGVLLTKILEAINFSREEVFIANIVKCRPPGNRTPLPLEMESCLPYLRKQIDLIKPKMILCLGLTAAQALLEKRDTLTNFRGKVFAFNNIKVMVTYHPAALLRNPNWKKGCWEDVQAFRKLYDNPEVK